jgi:hypothetical protein
LYIVIFTIFDNRIRQKVLDWLEAVVARIQFPPNFLQSQILICCCRSEIFQQWHIFTRSDCYFYFAILTCILATR